jgi:alanine dehydrogenase
MAIVLNETDVMAVLPMRDLIDAMEGALAKFSAGEVVQPVRSVLQVGPSKAFFGVMPAYQPAPAALGAKLVTVFAGNTAHGLPTHLATIILLDPDTGALAALMDGRFITEARTAAVSAVSVRHMARPEPPDGTTLAILGSGVQARSHLEAIALVRRLKEIRVWSPTPVNRDRFAREMASHAPASIRAVSSARAAVDGADIIVLATASPTPVVERGWAADGAHICAVGACRPDVREMDGPLVAAGRLIVDSRAGALAEAGDLVLAIKEGCCGPDHIAGELGEVVSKRMPGRTSPREITIFKSLGMAVEDVAAAELAWRRAAEQGLGRAVPL